MAKSVFRALCSGVCCGFPRQRGQIKHLEGEETIAKYHKGVKMPIAEAISMPLGGSHKPHSCMLTTVAAVLQKKHTESVNKDLKGWGMEGRLVLLLFVEGSDKRSS